MVYKKISEMNKFDWSMTIFLGFGVLAKSVWTFGDSYDIYAYTVGIFSIIIVSILFLLKIIFKIK